MNPTREGIQELEEEENRTSKDLSTFKMSSCVFFSIKNNFVSFPSQEQKTIKDYK